MERYKYTTILKDNNNKQYYSTVMYPKLKPTINDIYVVSKSGDRLDLYAKKYYNDVTKWVIIASANNIGKGTLSIPPGIQIRIPSNDKLFDDKLI